MTVLPPAIADLDQIVNVAFTSIVDQNAQYQQAGFAFHTWMTTRLGGVVEQSSNSVVAGIGNNIAGPLDIVHDSPGLPHSWAVYNFGGTRFLIDFNNFASAFPQQAELYRNADVYALDGTINNRPTPAFADREAVVISWNLIGWVAPVAGTISYQWSAAQQIGWFYTKQDSASDTASVVFIERAALLDDYYDGIRSWFILAGTDMVSHYNLNFSPGRIGGYDGTAGGTITATSPFGPFPGGFATNFVNGEAGDLRCRLLPTKYWAPNEIPQEDRRVGGYSQLRMKAPALTLVNQVNPNDPPIDVWEWRVLGADGILWRKADGPIV